MQGAVKCDPNDLYLDILVMTFITANNDEVREIKPQSAINNG